MRPLEELISTDPAFPHIQQWIADAKVPCEILPPSTQRDEALLTMQVTTHSILGSVIYDTGGILIDDGWLRFIGSGHPKLSRSIHTWNVSRAKGFFLVADDAVGGFFAINGGSLGDDAGCIYYRSPDALEWEGLDVSFSEFFQAMLSNRIAAFYDALRWPDWREDIVQQVTGDTSFHFAPPLWTKEGGVRSSSRRVVPVAEIYDLYVRQ